MWLARSSEDNEKRSRHHMASIYKSMIHFDLIQPKSQNLLWFPRRKNILSQTHTSQILAYEKTGKCCLHRIKREVHHFKSLTIH